MYLTRMRLDTKKRETIKALMAPSQFHSIIESSYSGEREHPLWKDLEMRRRTDVALELLRGNIERQRNADLKDPLFTDTVRSAMPYHRPASTRILSTPSRHTHRSG